MGRNKDKKRLIKLDKIILMIEFTWNDPKVTKKIIRI